jgi:ABC-2 type transport system permease protein
VSYTQFLVPGLVMMSMLQNAFSNSSSSLIQSKMTGNIVFVLLPPLSYLEFFLAYLGAAILRGLVVGLGVWGVTLWFAPWSVPHLGWMLAFALLAWWHQQSHPGNAPSVTGARAACRLGVRVEPAGPPG